MSIVKYRESHFVTVLNMYVFVLYHLLFRSPITARVWRSIGSLLRFNTFLPSITFVEKLSVL